jgi:stress response protein YsnF
VSNNKDESKKSKQNINFNDIIKKEAVGINGLDLGKVQEVGETFVITHKGLIEKKKYHLPVSAIESFDGEIVKLKINEIDLKSYEQTEAGNTFEGYSSFKSSDMSRELQTTIPLLDENLEITKKIIEDNIKIIKESVKETRSEEIELKYDKVTIIKRPVKIEMNIPKGESTNHQLETNLSTIHAIKKGDGVNESNRTEIIMVIEREEPVVTKRSFSDEEVIVKKQTLVETKKITEELIHEHIKFNNNELSKVDKDDFKQE